MNPSRSLSRIDRFPKFNVLVVGDLMLDHFIWGGVSRISPEAPVPVVEMTKETEMPGGAGNVAVNLGTLGAQVSLVGLVGHDNSSQRLLSLFRGMPIDTEPIVRFSGRPTIVKTRIIAQHQQVVRVDREARGGLPHDVSDQLWKRAAALLPRIDAIVLSDYAKGVLSSELLVRLIPAARRRGVPILVDPKVENFSRYRRVTCVTPNQKEAMECGHLRHLRTEEDLEALGVRLQKRVDAEAILITRGEKGMSLFERGKAPVHIPTRAREVFDVTGAGDTVVGVMALAMAAGAAPREAAELANYAAGIVVAKLGTASVTAAELKQVLRHAR